MAYVKVAVSIELPYGAVVGVEVFVLIEDFYAAIRNVVEAMTVGVVDLKRKPMPHSLGNVGLQRVIRASNSCLEWENISKPRIGGGAIRITLPASLANQLISVRRITIKHVRGMRPNVLDREQEVPSQLLVNAQTPLIEHRKLLVPALERSEAQLRNAARRRWHIWRARERPVRESRLECLVGSYGGIECAVCYSGRDRTSTYRPQDAALEKYIGRRILVEITGEKSLVRIRKDPRSYAQHSFGPHLPCDCGSGRPDDQRRVRDYVMLIPENRLIHRNIDAVVQVRERSR